MHEHPDEKETPRLQEICGNAKGSKFACDIIDLQKKPQQTTDHSTLYSQVSSHVGAGYNKVACSF